MEITICNQSSEKKWNRYRHDFEMIVQRASGIIEIPEGGCLSVIYVDPEQIHEINKEYRGIDRPTDVISFALMDEEDDYEVKEEENQPDNENNIGKQWAKNPLPKNLLRTKAHAVNHTSTDGPHQQ
ncbi:MAG: rRNA maturation RNase YbeY [Merdibacter sp.]|nr:rRNA maturation RNase YbeY [Merdibacter sp.]